MNEYAIYMYIHTQEYYSFMRKKEIMPFETTLMKFDDIILRNMLTVKKILYEYHIFNLKVKLKETEYRIVIIGVRKQGEMLVKGYRHPVIR